MTPGPQKNIRQAGPTFAEKAVAAWSPVPDWVEELAALADRHGIAGAGKRIGYSGSAVSTVISGKYGGDITRVEQMVRGALMAMKVDCPILGQIGRDRCLTEQKEEFRVTSAMRAQLFHACRNGCPHFRNKKDET